MEMIAVLVLAAPLMAQRRGVPLLDPAGGSHGSAAVDAREGLGEDEDHRPAAAAGGAAARRDFSAYVYKAYLTSSADPAVEIFLADVYPNAKGVAKAKVALKGDLSLLGLDRVVVTAYSKDARDSFDVLTATLP